MSTISASTTTTTAFGVTADTTGTLVFQTGASPTTALTIDTSQNVGIGTTSPSTYGKLALTTSSGTVAYFESTQSATNANNLIVNATQTNSSANIKLQINGGTTAQQGLRINGDGSLDFLRTTSDTNSMRIDSSGNVGIGTTSPTTYGAKLGVVNSASSGQTWVSIINNSSTVYEGAGVLMGSNAASTNYGGTLLYHTYFTSGTQNNTAYSFNISQRSATGSYVSNIWNVDYQNNVQTWYRPNTSVAQMSLNATGVLQIGTGASEVFAQNTVKVWGSIQSNGTFYTSFGASSISKNSTGYYTIGFTRTLASSRFGLAGAGYGGAIIFSGGNESTTSTGLRTYNDAGSLTDADFQFILAGGSS